MTSNYRIFYIYIMGISSIIGYDDLSIRKVATKSTTYPDWYKADLAVDRNITTCMRTNVIGPNSPEQTVWWKVDLGGVYNIYSVNILFKNYIGYEMRQRGRFAGFSLFVSKNGVMDNSTLCYKNGHELPPLNFTSTCNTSGRYVKFHNERLDGVNYPGYEVNNVYTELCEVIVYDAHHLVNLHDLCKTGCEEDGVYGSNCNESCPNNCLNHTCHIQSGTCISCEPGWSGTNCTTECTYGWYGKNCTHKCPGHCKDNVTCNHVTGQCDKGCDAGWTGSNCDHECAYGWHGQNCTNRCPGYCRNNMTCNHVTGRCDNGCDAGWTGSECNHECVDGMHGLNCSDKCSDQCLNKTSCDKKNATCEEKPNSEKDITSSHVQDRDMNDDNSDKAVVGGAVGGCIAVVLVAVIVLVMWLRKKSTRMSKSDFDVVFQNHGEINTQEESESAVIIEEATVYDRTDASRNQIKKTVLTRNIAIRNIKAQISNLSANENAGFKNEYDGIPRGEQYPCLQAKKAENKAKNRYTTIFPYDHSRVVLKNTRDGNDYINANYIEDNKGKRVYIATQGPKTKTITDFWVMVWQEEVNTIVCLTNLKEGIKTKCTKYWPNINDKLQAGQITIRHVEEKSYAEHIVRQFKLYYTTNEQERSVTMYHYTTWADHGVADPLSLVLFHRQVMKATAQSAGKYTLVHCSAGIGRTGTYIALDVLYREGERTGKIAVPMYVNTMRKDRMNMIQGEEQYRIVYLALMEAFSGPSKTMNRDVFISKYEDKNSLNKVALSSEFEELLSLRKVYSQKDYVSGRVHISANYTQTVLPLEEYMCRLSYKEGHNTYYNAVFLQSFLTNDAIISAQYPLPDYSEDFLRLTWDLDARILVFLSPIKELKSSSVWFPTKMQSKHSGEFTLELLSTTQAPYVTKTKLNLQKKGGNGREINIFECSTWNNGQSTGNKRVLLDVIKEVKKEKNMFFEGRIAVLSSDGATRCGPFCIVYNAIEQITANGEVDIFTTARQLQVRRPEFLSTWAEYQLCYEAVEEYLSNDSVYGNC